MEYHEFLCAVERKLNENLKKGTRAKLYSTIKNNGTKRTGVLIEQEGSNVGPTIYLEGFYQKYKEHSDLTEIVEELLSIYDSVKGTKVIEECQLDNYDVVKEKIVFKVVNYEKNKIMLEKIPHVRYLDLAIVFYILLEAEETGMATVLIKNEHIEMWKISLKHLYEVAIKNARTLLPAQFMSMRQVIGDLLQNESEEQVDVGERENEVMYILTNSFKNFGAACLAYPHVLEMIAELLHEDFYLLPSSVHEVIIVPESKAMEETEMNAMVVEINATQLEVEEVLSDHTYFYDAGGKKLKINR